MSLTVSMMVNVAGRQWLGREPQGHRDGRMRIALCPRHVVGLQPCIEAIATDTLVRIDDLEDDAGKVVVE